MSPGDQELLRRAASVLQARQDPAFANFEVTEDVGVRLELAPRRGAVTSYWNPFKDYGQALVLAVKLNIAFKYERNAPPEMRLPRECAIAITEDGQYFAEVSADPLAATCRAIVDAASAMLAQPTTVVRAKG